MKCRLIHCQILLAIILACQVSAQVLPGTRAVDWSLAGNRDRPPGYPLLFNILDFGGVGDGLAINGPALTAAITALGNQNGVIYFPPGNYYFQSGISLRSGIILRGAGAHETQLLFNLAGSGHLITIAGFETADSARVTSSVNKGQASLICDNGSLFHINEYIKLFQTDSNLVTSSWALGSVAQLLQVAQVNGNTLSFSSAFRKNYEIGNFPRIQKMRMVTGAGIECLKIKRLDYSVTQTSNIFMRNAANCWVQGVESDSCNFAHVEISASTNIEVTNCYFHGAFAYGGGGQGYGVLCENSSGECLVENNIFIHLRHALILQSGANGNVIDFNYSLLPYKSETPPYNLSGDIVFHGNYPYANLVEGNIVQNIVIDASHGINGNFNTIFRNRTESYGILASVGSGDSINVIANEIVGTGINMGNYLLQGTGNLEYANNINGLVYPAAISLTDTSFRYPKKPSFWNNSQWPPIGFPVAFNTNTIPAGERFQSSQPFAYCLPDRPFNYIFSGNGNWTVASNWLNNRIPPPVLFNGSEIMINPAAGGRCILNIPYTVRMGTRFEVKAGKEFLVNGNLKIE